MKLVQDRIEGSKGENNEQLSGIEEIVKLLSHDTNYKCT